MTKLNTLKVSFCASLLLVASGCSDDVTPKNSSVVSEMDLAQGSVKEVNESQVVILTLEHPENSIGAYDTNIAGNDCYTFRPTKGMNNIVIEIGEETSIGAVSIKELSTGTTVTATKNDNSRTCTFKAGSKYEYCVTHDGITDDTNHTETLFVKFESCIKPGLLGATQGDVNKLKTGRSCIGCDFSNFDFGSNNITLSNVDLTDSNLSEAVFEDNPTLDGSNFTRANLTGVNLNNASMIKTVMDNATISKEPMYGYFIPRSITGASFKNVNLSDLIFTSAGHDPDDNALRFKSVNFSGANLSKAEFQGFHFKNCTFDSANLLNATFRNVKLEENNSFVGADMRSVTLDGANFANADMSKADLSDASHDTDTVLTGAKGLLRFDRDDTVRDLWSGVMWQDNSDAKTLVMYWGNAYCDDLNFAGYTDWRLPTLETLSSVVDTNRQPKIRSAFNNTASAGYWTDTLKVRWPVTYPMYFSFDSGYGIEGSYYEQHNVRCVRKTLKYSDVVFINSNQWSKNISAKECKLTGTVNLSGNQDPSEKWIILKHDNHDSRDPIRYGDIIDIVSQGCRTNNNTDYYLSATGGGGKVMGAALGDEIWQIKDPNNSNNTDVVSLDSVVGLHNQDRSAFASGRDNGSISNAGGLWGWEMWHIVPDDFLETIY